MRELHVSPAAAAILAVVKDMRRWMPNATGDWCDRIEDALFTAPASTPSTSSIPDAPRTAAPVSGDEHHG